MFQSNLHCGNVMNKRVSDVSKCALIVACNRSARILQKSRIHPKFLLRCRSKAVGLLRLWVRIPPGHGCLSVVSVVLSGRGLCDELITCPEESYRLCCVIVCDLETSCLRRPSPTGGCCAKHKPKTSRRQWGDMQELPC